MKDETAKEYVAALEQAAKELRKAKADEKLIGKLNQIAGYISERAKIDERELQRELKEIQERYRID